MAEQHGHAQHATVDETPHTEEAKSSANNFQGLDPAPESKAVAEDAEKNSSNPPPKPKDDKEDGKEEEKGPAGGFDSTPIPKNPRGFTVKFTIHRATNLPMADLNTFSSDPYVIAQVNTDVPTRHKEDPYLRMRTPTIRRECNPEWNTEWVVANLPASGFKLKLRVYDEDPGDHDDRLGNVHITVHSLNESWEGFQDRAHKIMKKTGSKRAYLIRGVASCFGSTKNMHGDLYVSAELLGRTPEDGQNGRLYTLGPCWWTRHYSPLLGRIAHTEDDDQEQEANKESDPEKRKAKRYNFQANQMQLGGPVPPQLYHRYVEFKPWAKRMFTGSGVQGFFLHKALHHQHNQVYNFDRVTQWGQLGDHPGKEMTKSFLDLVHYDQGGRIYTYVITLDALFRFTETGKEFSIDMLSKHTMHSDVAMYIAWSGEFFVRRLKHPQRPPPPDPADDTDDANNSGENETHPPADIGGGPPESDPPKDPSYYQLVIDNDSGTYRPNAHYLPVLKEFLARQLPGLHIMTLDCGGDADKMNKMKTEQRERKKKEGGNVVFTQGDRSGSISSSDEEELDEAQAGLMNEEDFDREHGAIGQAAKYGKKVQQARWQKVKQDYSHKGRGDADGDDAVGESSTSEPNEKEHASGS